MFFRLSSFQRWASSPLAVALRRVLLSCHLLHVGHLTGSLAARSGILKTSQDWGLEIKVFLELRKQAKKCIGLLTFL